MARKAKKTAKKRSPTCAGKSTNKPNIGFLKQAHSAARSHLAGTTDLPTFLQSAGGLSLNGRKRLVDQVLLLIEGNYVAARKLGL
jgi:hypothetical protein